MRAAKYLMRHVFNIPRAAKYLTRDVFNIMRAAKYLKRDVAIGHRTHGTHYILLISPHYRLLH